MSVSADVPVHVVVVANKLLNHEKCQEPTEDRESAEHIRKRMSVTIMRIISGATVGARSGISVPLSAFPVAVVMVVVMVVVIVVVMVVVAVLTMRVNMCVAGLAAVLSMAMTGMPEGVG
mmetsp:Transcript_53083/g.115882  ORF Transcript_53083/g.115882 Transcript_53083/m.115882 type:complete len:119 (-) Transcript_53083:513-869(-)